MIDRHPLYNAIKAITETMRAAAAARKFVNPSHVLGYADRIDEALCASEPNRQQWRDAEPGKVQPPGWTDPLDPIRRVFREAGLYNHATDDLLCSRLAEVARAHHFPFKPSTAATTPMERL